MIHQEKDFWKTLLIFLIRSFQSAISLSAFNKCHTNVSLHASMTSPSYGLPTPKSSEFQEVAKYTCTYPDTMGQKAYSLSCVAQHISSFHCFCNLSYQVMFWSHLCLACSRIDVQVESQWFLHLNSENSFWHLGW